VEKGRFVKGRNREGKGNRERKKGRKREQGERENRGGGEGGIQMGFPT
jgi:hypothetical protein